MIYARVHDSQVAEDYFTAMARVEGRLEVGPTPTLEPKAEPANGVQPLLALVDQLKDADLGQGDREHILAELRETLLASQAILERL